MSGMLATIASVLMVAQTAVAMPPAPPPADPASIARPLKRACMSDAGIALVVKSSSEGQRAIQADSPNFKAIYKEVADAAYEEPVDTARLGRALQAQIDYQHSRSKERNTRLILLLEQLSLHDRMIYARTLSILKSNVPEKVCPTD